MNYANSKNRGWKKVGELNNFPNSDIEMMRSWLGTIVASLHLPSIYIAKISKTAKMAITRTAIDHAGKEIYTHLEIYVTHGSISNENTWGLFHMERIEFRDNSQNSLDHRINFYLYMENQAT
jgi:hypothetical protein